MMAEPAVKKLKDARSCDCTYTKEWADSYRVGPINGNKEHFTVFLLRSVTCTHQGLGDINKTMTEKYTKRMLLLHKVIR